jgi:hypothetical protein
MPSIKLFKPYCQAEVVDEGLSSIKHITHTCHLAGKVFPSLPNVKWIRTQEPVQVQKICSDAGYFFFTHFCKTQNLISSQPAHWKWNLHNQQL